MKLRNKRTGEVGKLHCDMNVIPAKYGVFEDTDIRGHYWEYDSLAELNEDWEDCKPAEPLIKDEKIRNLVRAWGDGNDAINVQFDAFWRGFRHNNSTITVWEDLPLEDNKIYSIAELCGEEEE